MSYLFFDTETTGLANFKLPATHPTQPRMIQLAALLCSDTGRELSQLNTLICPREPFEWVIDPKAFEKHGITVDRCMAEGIPIAKALSILCAMAYDHNLVAHNIQFDYLMVNRELHLLGHSLWDEAFPVLSCTMKLTTDICQLPAKWGFKWPKLQEAYKHCFGKEFVEAHDALADVRACKEVFFWLKEKGHVK